jgi:hypothetical protein
MQVLGELLSGRAVIGWLLGVLFILSQSICTNHVVAVRLIKKPSTDNMGMISLPMLIPTLESELVRTMGASQHIEQAGVTPNSPITIEDHLTDHPEGHYHQLTYQQFFSCDEGTPFPHRPLQGWGVYSLGDITLHGPKAYRLKQNNQKTGNFNSQLISEMTWAIGQQIQPTSHKPLVVDVGPGLGWITAHAVKAGARVFAFEATPIAVQYLYHSLRTSSLLMDSALLYPIGLGAVTEECIVIDASKSRYSTYAKRLCHAIKDQNVSALARQTFHEWRAAAWSDRAYRVGVAPLDKVVKKEHVHVLKVYVEDSTIDMLQQGARALLRQGRISYIILQVNESMVALDAAIEQLVCMLASNNFRCSHTGFQGPPIEESNMSLNPRNIYCTLHVNVMMSERL